MVKISPCHPDFYAVTTYSWRNSHQLNSHQVIPTDTTRIWCDALVGVPVNLFREVSPNVLEDSHPCAHLARILNNSFEHSHPFERQQLLRAHLCAILTNSLGGILTSSLEHFYPMLTNSPANDRAPFPTRSSFTMRKKLKSPSPVSF